MKTESVKLPVRWKDDSEAVPGVVGNIIDASGVIIAVCCTPQTGDQIARALNTQPQLLEACKGLFGMVEAGTLVRDCSHDADPKWYLTAMELTANLAKAQSAIAAAEKEKV